MLGLDQQITLGHRCRRRIGSSSRFTLSSCFTLVASGFYDPTCVRNMVLAVSVRPNSLLRLAEMAGNGMHVRAIAAALMCGIASVTFQEKHTLALARYRFGFWSCVASFKHEVYGWPARRCQTSDQATNPCTELTPKRYSSRSCVEVEIECVSSVFHGQVPEPEHVFPSWAQELHPAYTAGLPGWCLGDPT